MPPANNHSVGVHFNYKIKHENVVWWFRTGGWSMFHHHIYTHTYRHMLANQSWAALLGKVRSERYVLNVNTVMWLFNIFHLDKFVRRSFIRQCIAAVCAWSRVSGQKLGIQKIQRKCSETNHQMACMCCSCHRYRTNSQQSTYSSVCVSHLQLSADLVLSQHTYVTIGGIWDEFLLFSTSDIPYSAVRVTYQLSISLAWVQVHAFHVWFTNVFWNKRRWWQTCPRRTETHRWMWIWKHLDQFTILIAHQFRRISMCALCSLPVTLHGNVCMHIAQVATSLSTNVNAVSVA